MVHATRHTVDSTHVERNSVCIFTVYCPCSMLLLPVDCQLSVVDLHVAINGDTTNYYRYISGQFLKLLDFMIFLGNNFICC